MHPGMEGRFTNYPKGVSIEILDGAPVLDKPVLPKYITYACGHSAYVYKVKKGRQPDLAALAGQDCPVCRRRAWKGRR
jgi:hypothetical protein